MEPEGKGTCDEVVLGAGSQGWSLTGAEGTVFPELGLEEAGLTPPRLDTAGRQTSKQHLGEKAVLNRCRELLHGEAPRGHTPTSLPINPTYPLSLEPGRRESQAELTSGGGELLVPGATGAGEAPAQGA